MGSEVFVHMGRAVGEGLSWRMAGPGWEGVTSLSVLLAVSGDRDCIYQNAYVYMSFPTGGCCSLYVQW